MTLTHSIDSIDRVLRLKQSGAIGQTQTNNRTGLTIMTSKSSEIVATGKTTLKERSRQPGLRFWIEGGKLERSGFITGLAYSMTTTAGMIEIKLDKKGSNKVAGKIGRPIIDRHSMEWRESFDNTKVFVTYYAGRITVTNEQV